MKQDSIDDIVRRTLRLGMDSGTFLKIEYVYGFEKFNNRPYHCYETWCGGWVVTDPNMPWPWNPKLPWTTKNENLESAIKEWATQREKWNEQERQRSDSVREDQEGKG